MHKKKQCLLLGLEKHVKIIKIAKKKHEDTTFEHKIKTTTK